MTIVKVMMLGAPADQGVPLVAALERRFFAVSAVVRRRDALEGTSVAHLPAVATDIRDRGSLERAFAGHEAVAMHLPFFQHQLLHRRPQPRHICARRLSRHRAFARGNRDSLRIHRAGGVRGQHHPRLGEAIIGIRSIFAYSASPTLKINWVCLDDVAECMTAEQASDTADARCVPVGGPEALVGA